MVLLWGTPRANICIYKFDRGPSASPLSRTERYCRFGLKCQWVGRNSLNYGISPGNGRLKTFSLYRAIVRKIMDQTRKTDQVPTIEKETYKTIRTTSSITSGFKFSRRYIQSTLLCRNVIELLCRTFQVCSKSARLPIIILIMYEKYSLTK